MKKLYYVLIILVITSLSFKPKALHKDTHIYKNDKDYSSKKITIITIDQLLKINSKIESNGKWNVANKHGYVGKYQLGYKALKDVGYDTVWINKVQGSIYSVDTLGRTFYYFDVNLFSPKMQNVAIKRYMKKIETIYMKKCIRVHVGKIISNVRITKAGILSASFLGFGKVELFLKSNGKINPRDANGHSVKERLIKFQNVELI